MGSLENCVVIDDKVYCWDCVLQKVVEASLQTNRQAVEIPEIAIEAVFRKRYDTKKKGGE